MWHQQKYSKSKENNESTKKRVNVGKNPFSEELMVRYMKEQVD